MFSGMVKYLGKKLQWKIGEVSEQYLRILLEHISPVSVSSLILCNLLFHSWFFKILVWGNESTLSSLVVKLKLENKIASSHMQNWGLLSTFRVAIWPILVLNLVKMINAFFFSPQNRLSFKMERSKKGISYYMFRIIIGTKKLVVLAHTNLYCFGEIMSLPKSKSKDKNTA